MDESTSHGEESRHGLYLQESPFLLVCEDLCSVHRPVQEPQVTLVQVLRWNHGVCWHHRLCRPGCCQHGWLRLLPLIVRYRQPVHPTLLLKLYGFGVPQGPSDLMCIFVQDQTLHIWSTFPLWLQGPTIKPKNSPYLIRHTQPKTPDHPRS